MTTYHYIAIAWLCLTVAAGVAHAILRERWTRITLAAFFLPLAGVAWAWGAWRPIDRAVRKEERHVEPPGALPPRTLPTQHTTPEDYHETPDHPGPDADLADRVEWYKQRTDALD